MSDTFRHIFSQSFEKVIVIGLVVFASSYFGGFFLAGYLGNLSAQYMALLAGVPLIKNIFDNLSAHPELIDGPRTFCTFLLFTISFWVLGCLMIFSGIYSDKTRQPFKQTLETLWIVLFFSAISGWVALAPVNQTFFSKIMIFSEFRFVILAGFSFFPLCLFYMVGNFFRALSLKNMGQENEFR